jgi:hypothetical protein
MTERTFVTDFSIIQVAYSRRRVTVCRSQVAAVGQEQRWPMTRVRPGSVGSVEQERAGLCSVSPMQWSAIFSASYLYATKSRARHGIAFIQSVALVEGRFVSF